jgi:hypothetical protein
MDQLHRCFSNEQVKVLLQSYCQGKITRTDLQQMLDVEKTRFFALLKSYRQNPETFTITYLRTTSAWRSAQVESEIEHALLQEKRIVQGRQLPISEYNYTAMRDRLRKASRSL